MARSRLFEILQCYATATVEDHHSSAILEPATACLTAASLQVVTTEQVDTKEKNNGWLNVGKLTRVRRILTKRQTQVGQV